MYQFSVPRPHRKVDDLAAQVSNRSSITSGLYDNQADMEALLPPRQQRKMNFFPLTN